MKCTFYDLNEHRTSPTIDLLFRQWTPGDERVVIFSPHDDDGVLGAGHLIQVVRASGGEAFVVVFCQGNAGYTTIGERSTIVDVRKDETLKAYEILGLDAKHILRMEYSDFSVLGHVGWILPTGELGTFPRMITLLRSIGATRLVVPNQYREHIDHEAVGRIGAYDGPQAGDPILADWGTSVGIRSFLEYAVWGDFSPEDALIQGRDKNIRANRALKVPFDAEEKVLAAIGTFNSQQKTIASLTSARQHRRVADGVLELYIEFDPRPILNFFPYVKLVETLDNSNQK